MKKNLNKKNEIRILPSALIDDIRLRGRKIILIEGKDNSNDKKVYEKVVCEDVTIFPGGKKQEILNRCSKNNKEFAIVDKDYDIPDDTLSNVFYTDYNDIECTAINITNESGIMYDSLHIKKPNKEVFERNIYRKTLELAKQISNINRYIYEYNNNYNTKYKYLIKNYIDNSYRSFNNIGNIRNIDFLSNNNKLKMSVIVNLYNNKIDFTEDALKQIVMKDTNGFRGHDFFIILAYLLDQYEGLTFEEYEFDRVAFSNRSYSYLEEKYIDIFSKNKEIKKSKLYISIIDSKQGLFKEYE